jgi:hypothetical protein
MLILFLHRAGDRQHGVRRFTFQTDMSLKKASDARLAMPHLQSGNCELNKMSWADERYLGELTHVVHRAMNHLDDRAAAPDQRFLDASETLQCIMPGEYLLPNELQKQLSTLMGSLRAGIWNEFPQAGEAEIRRFAGALVELIRSSVQVPR